MVKSTTVEPVKADFTDPDVDPNPWNRPETVALALAVLHHGMSNWAERSIPPRAETVIDTAAKFKRHLDNLPPDPLNATPHR